MLLTASRGDPIDRRYQDSAVMSIRDVISVLRLRRSARKKPPPMGGFFLHVWGCDLSKVVTLRDAVPKCQTVANKLEAEQRRRFAMRQLRDVAVLAAVSAWTPMTR